MSMGQGAWGAMTVGQPRLGQSSWVCLSGVALTGPCWVRREELRGSGWALHRDLYFSSFDSQHLHTNFTCVVLSPFGVDIREVRWPSPALAPGTGKSGGLG